MRIRLIKKEETGYTPISSYFNVTYQFTVILTSYSIDY